MTAASRHSRPFGTLKLPPPDPACQLIITIPAKDEAHFITHTLDALAAQVDPAGVPLDPSSYEVIILANNCSDDTAGICRRYVTQPTHPRAAALRLHVAERRLPRAIACVGTARRLMMDTAADRLLRIGNPRGTICTTDADTLVDPEWVYWTLDSVAKGARAVGGRILVPDNNRSTVTGHYRKDHLLDVTYRSLQYCLESMIDPDPADPWPRHFQHFGPSTAVRVDAYLECGGIPPLKCLEDVGLVRALERVDISVTHNPNVRVYTSSRVSHRVDGTAFSHQLDEWAAAREQGGTQHVIGLENCRWLFKWKVALRRVYVRGDASVTTALASLSQRLNITQAELMNRIRSSRSFGELYQSVREQLEGCPNFSGTPIEEAVRELRRFTSSLRHRGEATNAGTPPGGTVRGGHSAPG